MRFELAARGPDAENALAELKSRFESGLGETLESSTSQRRNCGCLLTLPDLPVPSQSLLASPSGALFFAASRHAEIPLEKVSDTRKEKEKLRRAIETAKAELAQDEMALRDSLGEEEAEIFRAQALILDDPELLQASEKAIEDGHQNAAQAWHRSYQAAATAYQRLE